MKKKTSNLISSIFAFLAFCLSWLSCFYLMTIVYDSLAASLIFSTVVAVIVFCESRFTYISLKSDGKIAITREEIRSNAWQIVASTMVALLVSLPLEMYLFASRLTSVSFYGHPMRSHLQLLADQFPAQWLPMVLVGLLVLLIFLVPIFVRMATDD